MVEQLEWASLQKTLHLFWQLGLIWKVYHCNFIALKWAQWRWVASRHPPSCRTDPFNLSMGGKFGANFCFSANCWICITGRTHKKCQVNTCQTRTGTFQPWWKLWLVKITKQQQCLKKIKLTLLITLARNQVKQETKNTSFLCSTHTHT